MVRHDVLAAFVAHHADYIAYPYALLTNVMPGLGCTRFSHAFLARHPLAALDAQAYGVGFRQFDVVLMRRVLAARGEQPTVLLPPVEHLNEAKALRPGVDPTPMMRVPVPGVDEIGNLQVIA